VFRLEASREFHQAGGLGTVMTPIRTTLGRDLTIQAISAYAHTALGRSLFDFVPPSHHNLLESARRELFERHHVVSFEVPTVGTKRGAPQRWFVRAAPVREAHRVVAAVAHAVPCADTFPVDCQTLNNEAWERELALRELMPILRGLNAAIVSVVGRHFSPYLGCAPPVSTPGVEASTPGSARRQLRLAPGRSTARSYPTRQTK
jgi:hypothetical protein